MKPADFTPLTAGSFQLNWNSPDGEKVVIQIIAPPDTARPDEKLVAHIEKLVRGEPELRRKVAQAVYPGDADWLKEDLGIGSPEALLSVMEWTTLGVVDPGDGEYETQLWYHGPDSFQSITAKHFVWVDIDHTGNVESHFEPYDED